MKLAKSLGRPSLRCARSATPFANASLHRAARVTCPAEVPAWPCLLSTHSALPLTAHHSPKPTAPTHHSASCRSTTLSRSPASAQYPWLSTCTHTQRQLVPGAHCAAGRLGRGTLTATMEVCHRLAPGTCAAAAAAPCGDSIKARICSHEPHVGFKFFLGVI
jgi:hypothetical protein